MLVVDSVYIILSWIMDVVKGFTDMPGFWHSSNRQTVVCQPGLCRVWFAKYTRQTVFNMFFGHCQVFDIHDKLVDSSSEDSLDCILYLH